MENQSNPFAPFSQEEKIKILLEEYQAIEQMHAHYDVLNMSMMAIITAGVFAVWGVTIQAAFQSHAPVKNPAFVNSISVLALALFFILSIWIRYMTIHRCIVIQKLTRSHEIEAVLKMRQNSSFRYDSYRFSASLAGLYPLPKSERAE